MIMDQEVLLAIVLAVHLLIPTYHLSSMQGTRGTISGRVGDRIDMIDRMKRLSDKTENHMRKRWS